MENILIRAAWEEDYGTILLNIREFAEARRYYERKLWELTAESGGNQLELLSIKEKLAWSVYEMGNFLEAKELCQKAVREMELILVDSHPLCVRIYMSLSVLITKVGKKSEGDMLIEKLSKILNNMDKNNENFALNCLQIAISFVNLCKTTEAERILEELLQRQKNIFWKNLPLSLLMKMVTGRILVETGKFSEAVAYVEDILRTYSDVFTKEYRLNNLCRLAIPISFYGMGKYSEAKIQFEEILKGLTNRFGNESVERLGILTAIAECCRKLEKFGEAKGLLQEVQRKVTDIYGKESFYYLENSLRIIEIVINLGNFPVAKSLLEELSRKVKHAYGESNQLFLQVLELKAKLKMEMGKIVEARVMLEELVLKQLDVVGKYHIDYLSTKKMLAELLYNSCKFAESGYIFKDLLRLLSENFRTDYLGCLVAKMWIAKTNMRMQKFTESETLLKEVVSKLKEELGEDHRDTIDAMGLLAATLFHLGKKEEGFPFIDVYKRKMEVKKVNLEVVSIISLLLMEVGEWGILTTIVEKSVVDIIESFGDNHVITVDFQVKLAYCHLKGKKLGKVREVINNVLAKLPNVSTENDAHCLEIKEGIANCLIGIGECKRAIVFLEEILKKCNEANESKAPTTMHKITYITFLLNMLKLGMLP